jgi:hypothetical protein
MTVNIASKGICEGAVGVLMTPPKDLLGSVEENEENL